jgi:hypothetical protein
MSAPTQAASDRFSAATTSLSDTTSTNARRPSIRDHRCASGANFRGLQNALQNGDLLFKNRQ